MSSLWCVSSSRYCHLLRWLATQITRTRSTYVWTTGQKPISDRCPARTMATWNRTRPRGSLQVSGIDFTGPFSLTIFLLLRNVAALLIFILSELINNSDSNGRSLEISPRFVSRQLYSRMWKWSSLLYITVGSQPYKTPLRPCLFSISPPSLLVALSHIL